MSHRLGGWAAGALLLSALARPALAQDATLPPPTPDPFSTIAAPVEGWVSPTPDAAGTISIVVQPNESLWAIAARAGLSLPDLLALNGLTENDIIQPGDVLIIGYGTPNGGLLTVEEQSPTPTLPPPTLRPTAAPPRAAICISAFEDRNRNMVREPDEPLRPGVAFTIFNTAEVVANYITDGVSEPKCIEDLPPGQYSVTRSVIPGELLTTDGNWALTLTRDSVLQQAFGSVLSGEGEAAVATPLEPSPQSPSIGTPVAAVGDLATEAPAAGQSPPVRSLAIALAVGGGLLLVAAVLILLVRSARRAE